MDNLARLDQLQRFEFGWLWWGCIHALVFDCKTLQNKPTLGTKSTLTELNLMWVLDRLETELPTLLFTFQGQFTEKSGRSFLVAHSPMEQINVWIWEVLKICSFSLQNQSIFGESPWQSRRLGSSGLRWLICLYKPILLCSTSSFVQILWFWMGVRGFVLLRIAVDKQFDLIVITVCAQGFCVPIVYLLCPEFELWTCPVWPGCVSLPDRVTFPSGLPLCWGGVGQTLGRPSVSLQGPCPSSGMRQIGLPCWSKGLARNSSPSADPSASGHLLDDCNKVFIRHL